MHSVDTATAKEHLSHRIRRLRLAAEEARAEADLVMANAARGVAGSESIVQRLLRLAGGKAIQVVGRTVVRHPVSSLLIAGVIVGTVLYHRQRNDPGDPNRGLRSAHR